MGKSRTAELVAEMLLEMATKVPMRLKVRGTSMLPCIPSGSMVHLHPVSANGVHCGQLALIRVDGHFVLHRVLRVSKRNSCVSLAADSVDARHQVPLCQVIAIAHSVEIQGRERCLVAEQGQAWRALGALWKRVRSLRSWLARKRGRLHGINLDEEFSSARGSGP